MYAPLLLILLMVDYRILEDILIDCLLGYIQEVPFQVDHIQLVHVLNDDHQLHMDEVHSLVCVLVQATTHLHQNHDVPFLPLSLYLLHHYRNHLILHLLVHQEDQHIVLLHQYQLLLKMRIDNLLDQNDRQYQ